MYTDLLPLATNTSSTISLPVAGLKDIEVAPKPLPVYFEEIIPDVLLIFETAVLNLILDFSL
jgi:hypothetical protein